jgi:hypothetical protein
MTIVTGDMKERNRVLSIDRNAPRAPTTGQNSGNTTDKKCKMRNYDLSYYKPGDTSFA